MASDRQVHSCSVCRDTRRCTFCNGDGYVVEHDRLNACGVCETSGICSVCRPNEAG